jgi:hypothetical protein
LASRPGCGRTASGTPNAVCRDRDLTTPGSALRAVDMGDEPRGQTSIGGCLVSDGRRSVDLADRVARDGCKPVGDLGVDDRLRPGDHQGLTEAGAFDKDGGGPCTPSPLLVGGLSPLGSPRP